MNEHEHTFIYGRIRNRYRRFRAFVKIVSVLGIVGTVIAIYYFRTMDYQENNWVHGKSCLALFWSASMVLAFCVPFFIVLWELRNPSRTEGDGMTYQQQLKDPRWMTVSTRILQRDGFRCSDCGQHPDHPEVHHRYYLPGKMAWEHDPTILRTLCRACHGKIHGYDTQGKRTGNVPPLCSRCGGSVTPDQSYGFDGNDTYYCEACVNETDIQRGELA